MMSGIMCTECATMFFTDPFKIGIVIASFMLSILLLIMYIKSRSLSVPKRVTLLYGHLFFLMFPLVFYYLYRGCVSVFTNCNVFHKLGALLFFTVLVSFLIG